MCGACVRHCEVLDGALSAYRERTAFQATRAPSRTDLEGLLA